MWFSMCKRGATPGRQRIHYDSSMLLFLSTREASLPMADSRGPTELSLYLCPVRHTSCQQGRWPYILLHIGLFGTVEGAPRTASGPWNQVQHDDPTKIGLICWIAPEIAWPRVSLPGSVAHGGLGTSSTNLSSAFIIELFRHKLYHANGSEVNVLDMSKMY